VQIPGLRHTPDRHDSPGTSPPHLPWRWQSGASRYNPDWLRRGYRRIGQVRLRGELRSLIDWLWRLIGAVLIQESGFLNFSSHICTKAANKRANVVWNKEFDQCPV
jgi:hypothetical protein